MNIRRLLTVAAIPFMIGTFGFVGTNQANAEAPSHRHTQIAEQLSPNKKPQIKHQQARPQQKKRPPQVNPQNTNHNHQDLNSQKKNQGIRF
ncbi:hypothetical protein NIES2109_15470 [Nostoc sp. HK-01]|nr:hypothetical protein NIES2109_15470 [Nostoc sp. HK-01]